MQVQIFDILGPKDEVREPVQDVADEFGKAIHTLRLVLHARDADAPAATLHQDIGDAATRTESECQVGRLIEHREVVELLLSEDVHRQHCLFVVPVWRVALVPRGDLHLRAGRNLEVRQVRRQVNGELVHGQTSHLREFQNRSRLGVQAISCRNGVREVKNLEVRTHREDVVQQPPALPLLARSPELLKAQLRQRRHLGLRLQVDVAHRQRLEARYRLRVESQSILDGGEGAGDLQGAQFRAHMHEEHLNSLRLQLVELNTESRHALPVRLDERARLAHVEEKAVDVYFQVLTSGTLEEGIDGLGIALLGGDAEGRPELRGG